MTEPIGWPSLAFTLMAPPFGRSTDFGQKKPIFFFNDTTTTEIYTLSLHDALPISFAGLHHRVPSAGFPLTRE